MPVISMSYWTRHMKTTIMTWGIFMDTAMSTKQNMSMVIVMIQTIIMLTKQNMVMVIVMIQTIIMLTKRSITMTIAARDIIMHISG